MYTLNLKDIDLSPKIESEKMFEAGSETEVINLAVNYINENYKDPYNPYTLQRKCTDALLHDGTSLAQESKQHLDALSEKQDADTQKAVAGIEDRNTKYEEKAKEVYKKFDDLKTKLSETLENKAKELNLDTESEEYKKAEEEYKTDKESLEWEQDKELKSLYQEIHKAE